MDQVIEEGLLGETAAAALRKKVYFATCTHLKLPEPGIAKLQLHRSPFGLQMPQAGHQRLQRPRTTQRAEQQDKTGARGGRGGETMY